MIHRALLGSIERFFGVLIEHYAGVFPLWLAPVQVVVINITDEQKEYATEIHKKLLNAGIRSELNIKNERLNYKIREATLSKIPYMLVVGKKENDENRISIRTLTDKNLQSMTVDEFLSCLKEKIQNRS